MPMNVTSAPLTFKGTKENEDKAQNFQNTCKKVEDASGVAADSFQTTSKNVAAAGVTATGLWATLRKPFVSLSEWMKEPLRDADGTIKKKALENGKEIILKSDKYSKNKIIGVSIAAGVAVLGVAIGLIAKHAKKAKAEKEAKAEEQKKAELEAQEKAKAEAKEEAREKAKIEAEAKAKAEAEAKAKAKEKAEAEEAADADEDFDEDDDE